MTTPLKRTLALLCMACVTHLAWAQDPYFGVIGGKLMNDTNAVGGENLYIAIVNRTRFAVRIEPDFTDAYDAKGFRKATMPGTIPAGYAPAQADPGSAYAHSNPKLAAIGMAFANFPQENSFHFEYGLRQIGRTLSGGVFRVDNHARARYKIVARNRAGQDVPIELKVHYGSTASDSWASSFIALPLISSMLVGWIGLLGVSAAGVAAPPFAVVPMAGVALALITDNALSVSGLNFPLFNSTYAYAALEANAPDNEYKSDVLNTVIRNGIQYSLVRVANSDPHITNLPGTRDALLVLTIENVNSAQRSCTNMVVAQDKAGRHILSAECGRANGASTVPTELDLSLGAPDSDIVNRDGLLEFTEYLAPSDGRPYGQFLQYCSLHSYDLNKKTAQAQCHFNPATRRKQEWLTSTFWFGQCPSAQLRLDVDGQLACEQPRH